MPGVGRSWSAVTGVACRVPISKSTVTHHRQQCGDGREWLWLDHFFLPENFEDQVMRDGVKTDITCYTVGIDVCKDYGETQPLDVFSPHALFLYFERCLCDFDPDLFGTPHIDIRPCDKLELDASLLQKLRWE